MKIKLSNGKVWNVSKFGENIACTISSGVTLMKELREYIKANGVELATITVLPALTVGVFWAIWVVIG